MKILRVLKVGEMAEVPPNPPPKGPPPALVGSTIIERLEQYRDWAGLSYTQAGRLVGKAGYQNWKNYLTGSRKPGLAQIRKIVANSASQHGYKDEDFYKGTVDEARINSATGTEEDVDVEPPDPNEDAELDRGAALVFIEDSSYPDAIKARLRGMLAKYKQRSWSKRYLTIVADMLSDSESEIDAHAAALQHSKEVVAASEPPVELPKPAPKSEPPPPMPRKRKQS